MRPGVTATAHAGLPRDAVTRGPRRHVYVHSPHPLGPYPGGSPIAWTTGPTMRLIGRFSRTRRERRLVPADLRPGARARARARAGAPRPRPVARSPHRHPVGQQHRARPAGARGDVLRHALRAHRSCLLAPGRDSRHAAPPCERMRPGWSSRRTALHSSAALRHVMPSGVEIVTCVAAPRNRRNIVGGARSGALLRRGGRCACGRDRRHDRKSAVHVGIDGPAQRGHQHTADAVRESGTDPDSARVSGGSTADPLRLAAVEPHVRRQPQLRHRPLQRWHVVLDDGRPVAGQME